MNHDATTSNDSPSADQLPADLPMAERPLTVPFHELVRMLESLYRESHPEGVSPSPVENQDSESQPPHQILNLSRQQVEQLIGQLEQACHQRNQLAEIEAELSTRIEKLNGQKKSLSRKFRKEWKEIKIARQELSDERSRLEQSRLETSTTQDSFNEQTRQLARSRPQIASCDGGSEGAPDLNASQDEHGQSNADAADARAEELFEIKRELERALHELHDVKAENNRLRSSANPQAIEVPQGTNWEEMKKAFINDLEDDSEAEIPDTNQLIETVKNSKQVIQQKDEIIRRLEALVKENLKAKIDGARDARKKILDENEVVAKEIERLNELQQKWRDKIGRAEVELAQERARLARDRSELDEQIEEFEELQEVAENPEAPRGHKWREHLGLE